MGKINIGHWIWRSPLALDADLIPPSSRIHAMNHGKYGDQSGDLQLMPIKDSVRNSKITGALTRAGRQNGKGLGVPAMLTEYNLARATNNSAEPPKVSKAGPNR